MKGAFITVDKDRYYRHGEDFETEFDFSNGMRGGSPDRAESYLFVPDAAKGFETKVRELIGTTRLWYNQSNAAHHLSYFLAREAAAASKLDKKLKIINFDQHNDYQFGGKKPKESPLYCGNWGGYLAEEGFSYTVYGAGENAGAFDKGKINSFVDMQVIEFSKKSYVFPFDPKTEQLYVSVDLDILNGAGRTNWRQGLVGVEALASLLNQLPPHSIYAADVTGFPPKIPATKPDTVMRYLAEATYIGEMLSLKF